MTRTRRAAGFAAATSLMALAAAMPSLAQDAPPPPAQTAPAASAPAAPAAVVPLTEGVVATVNDDAISSYDLTQRMHLLILTTGVQPTNDNIPQIEREALRDLIDAHLEMQEVRHQEKEQKFTITADDKDVTEAINHMAESSKMTGPQLLATLSANGIAPATLREQLRAQISWQRWISGRYGGNRLKVSQTQVNAFYDQMQAEAAEPQFQISDIFLDATRAGGMDQAVAGAQQLLTQLQQGAPFAGVAKQFSSASSAAKGGDEGWVPRSALPAEVVAVLDQMTPGSLSRPVAAKGGVYIIQLRGKREGAGADMVSLKQAAISLSPSASSDEVAAAQTKLMALKRQITSCDDMDKAAAKFNGVVAADLGEASLKDLRPDFRDVAAKLKVNEVSDPIRTDVGLHLIAVCGRRLSGANIPSRDEIEQHLEDEQLSQLARRYLRDLRSSATIETR